MQRLRVGVYFGGKSSEEKNLLKFSTDIDFYSNRELSDPYPKKRTPAQGEDALLLFNPLSTY
jgi:hypothetical protein